MEVTDSESLVNFQGRPASPASWKTVLTICLALVAGVLADDAIKTAQNARDSAAASGLQPWAQRNEQLLELYLAGKPYHEAPTPPH